ncbi:hypothetical protein EGW08_022935 [Elysia chlorotica]|uniref:Fibronectin type-III domain-containing protein n=1 Tax=Elysia chlorotica TaxID=188477 RepID=A0A3S1AQN0_ELYCH|nr:hypothetical protein EGW08_022935 [Elysia chlorotica]
MWADMRCNRQNKVLVTNYNVSICPKNLQRQSHRSCKSVKILSQEGNTHVFRNLDVGRPYIIHVQAESDGGASQFTTTEFTPSDKGNSVSNIGLIMGILSLIILLAMIFLCFAWRYCRTRCKKANEMVKQNMQSMGQSEKMSIGHSESDSGVYSTTDKQKLVSLPPSGPQQEEAKVNAAPHKQSQPNARLSKLTSPHTDNQKNQQSEEAISSYSKQAPQDNHAKNEQTKNALIDKTNSSHMRFRNVTKQLACIEEDKGIGSTKDHRAHSPLDLWQRKDMCGPPKVNVCVAVEAPSSHARSSMAPGIASMKSMPSENEYSQQGIHKGGNRPLVDLVQSSNKLSDGYSEDPLSLDRDDVSCDGSEDSGDRDGYGDQSECDDGYKEDAERMASDSLHLKNDGYAEDRVAADPAYDGYKYNESGSKTGQFWEESSLCSESEREDLACSSVEREPTSSGYQCHSFLQASSMPAHRV